MTDWQNRIIGLEHMPAHQLLANPLNARRHPGKQREALRGSLDTLGWYDAVILNQRTGYLIDGHARVEEQLTRDENAMVPVLVVDMSESEEAQALASHDWITQLAEYDKQTLDDLLRATNSDDERVQALLSDLAAKVAPDIFIPEPVAKLEPQIKSEHLVTILCSAAALAEMMPLLEQIEAFENATVNIS